MTDKAALKADYHRRWRKANPEKVNAYKRKSRLRRRETCYNYKLRKKYGITNADYLRMQSEQGGKCAICHNGCDWRRLQVDHCHETGRIRGLLCSSCNIALGLFKDDPRRLADAIDYITPALSVVVAA